ncbi:MAG: protein phosphatase 2C domain-containing protein [Caldilineales bacterium]|nr:protein phosphatase 2C domain-containing protein [Caldilineales bacterium]MCW5857755.1 protein phosphatase 2C domain-containing protein [Caldilineales bacterium]
MKTQVSYATHIGSRHTVNQDAAGFGQGVPVERIEGRGQLFVLADGYGKDQAGSSASQTAVQSLTRFYYDSHEADTGMALVKAVQQANEAVVKAVGHPGSAGSTLTAAVMRQNSLHVAHVGDSRAYLLRDGQLRRLTHDHTWGAEQVRAGKLKSEQVAQDPKRGQLTRALGMHSSLPAEQVEHRAETVQAGDVLLLCSDGLTDIATETDLASQLGQAQAAEHLAALPGQRHGTDDVTVIVVQAGAKRVWPVPIVLAVAGGVVLLLSLLLVWLLPEGGGSSSPVAKTGTAHSAQVTAAAGSGTPAPATAQDAIAPTSTLAPAQPGASASAPRGASTAALPPAATVSPSIIYPAPILTDPEDNAEFRGRETPIRLQWRSVGALAADEVYVVTIDFPHEGAIWHDSQVSTATEVMVPVHVYDNLGGDRRLSWRVAVWRQPVVRDGLPVGTRVGGESAGREFVWKSEGNEPPTPQATPTFEG